MAEELLQLSRKELERVQVIGEVLTGGITQRQAGERLDLGVRQVKRLCRLMRAEQAAGLASKRRGRPSNHQLDGAVKKEALRLVRELYVGFGPTLAQEKLWEHHDLRLSKETLRRLMIADGLWRARRQKKTASHPRRDRRPRRGELVQLDGSFHLWLEDRSSKFTLLASIDDATSHILAARFVLVESTSAYFELVHDLLLEHGLPLSFYSDRHSIFRHTATAGSLEPSVTMTQFARALGEIGCELICARSPQAKGRVERLFGVLQDRLVKELRLAKVSTMEAANAFLPAFIAEYNARFGVVPASDESALRPLLAPLQEQLPAILCHREERTLSRTLTLQYGKRLWQIVTNRPEYALRHQKVQVLEKRDGQLEIRYRGQVLAYRVVTVASKQARVANEKEIAVARPASRLTAPTAFKASISSSFHAKRPPAGGGTLSPIIK